MVERCRSGDARAFEQLVGRYEGILYRLAYRMTGNPEDALDLTQAAFLKAYQKLDTYGENSKFFSWIYRITVNEALNHLARLRGRQNLIQKLAEPGGNETLADAESDEWVQPALLGLSLEHRIAIILRHFLDLSYREMAEVLGIPEKTVKSRLFSARRLLRDFLVEQAPDLAKTRR